MAKSVIQAMMNEANIQVVNGMQTWRLDSTVSNCTQMLIIGWECIALIMDGGIGNALTMKTVYCSWATDITSNVISVSGREITFSEQDSNRFYICIMPKGNHLARIS